MATTVTAPERKVSAAEAREVAEAAREQEWAAPSFVRDLFLGKLRMELIHPYPESAPDDAERARRSSNSWSGSCATRWTPTGSTAKARSPTR